MGLKKDSGARLFDVVGAFLAYGLTIFAFSAAADICGDQLRHETIKNFRSAGDYHATSAGTYFFRSRRVTYAPLNSNDLITAKLGNSASHIEIMRRTMGEAQFAKILRSADPKAAFDATVREIARKEEVPEVVLDADEIKAEIEMLSDASALTPQLEATVFKMLRQMGRLATPMSAWAKPLAQAGLLQQLPPKLIDGPIQTKVRPGIFIYKAILVTVLLDGPKTFVVSAGGRGHPDQTHGLIREALEMIVPRARIKNFVPAYIVVRPNRDGGGQLDLVDKSEQGLVLQREDYK